MDDYDNKFNGIIIQSADTDVFILSLSHIKLIMLQNYFIKKFNTTTKLSTIINIKEIGKLMQHKWNLVEPNILLSLHAISGYDTTSFTRNITKTNYFITYMSNPNQYRDLINFGDDPTVTLEPIEAAEELLAPCYKNSRGYKSSTSQTTYSSSSSSLSTTTTIRSSKTTLNSLRTSIALKHLKNRTVDICTKLPPTSDSFHQYCLRARRQVYIWKKAFEQYDIIDNYSMEDYGYQKTNNGECIIRWMTIPATPDDMCLTKCTSGCQRCKCSTYNLPCTPFCGCSVDQCTNRTDNQINSKIFF